MFSMHIDMHLTIRGNPDGSYTLLVGGFEEDEAGDMEEVEFNGDSIQKCLASYHRFMVRYYTSGNVKPKKKQKVSKPKGKTSVTKTESATEHETVS